MAPVVVKAAAPSTTVDVAIPESPGVVVVLNLTKFPAVPVNATPLMLTTVAAAQVPVRSPPSVEQLPPEELPAVTKGEGMGRDWPQQPVMSIAVRSKIFIKALFPPPV